MMISKLSLLMLKQTIPQVFLTDLLVRMAHVVEQDLALVETRYQLVMEQDLALVEARNRLSVLKQPADDIAKIQEVQQGPGGLQLRSKARRVFIDAGCSPSQVERLVRYDMRWF